MPGQAKDDSSLISPEWIVASAALFMRTTQCTIDFGQNVNPNEEPRPHNLPVAPPFIHNKHKRSKFSSRKPRIRFFLYIYIKTQPTLQKAPRHLSFVTKTERHGPKVSKKKKIREKKQRYRLLRTVRMGCTANSVPTMGGDAAYQGQEYWGQACQRQTYLERHTWTCIPSPGIPGISIPGRDISAPRDRNTGDRHARDRRT